MRAAGKDRHTASDGLNRERDDAQPLGLSQRGGFAGGAAGDKKADAAGGLPVNQRGESGFVNAAVCTERRDQRGAAANRSFHVHDGYKFILSDS